MANSLKDMLSSVDWGKMMSGADARNALVGSALGGLVLGGTSLMSDHDPEEGKMAPVGDALTGALLGGVAGYAVPKGLALFRDGGSLAPDNDKLRYNLLGSAALGGTVGAGTIGASLYWPFRDTAAALKARVASDKLNEVGKLNQAIRGAIRHGDRALENMYRQEKAMWGTPNEANAVFDQLKEDIRAAGRRGSKALRSRLHALKLLRNRATRGYSSFGDLIRAVGDSGTTIGNATEPRIGLLERIFSKAGFKERFRGALTQWRDAYHYRPATRGLKWLRGPGGRMLGRAGRYGAAGAGIAMLLNLLKGPGSSNNYKN